VKGVINCYSPTFPYQFENGPQTSDAGLEMGLQFKPKATLSGYLNYAYLHPLSESADPLRRLPYPRHLASLGANYQWGTRIRVQGDVHVATAVPQTSAILQNQQILAMSFRSSVQPIVNLRAGYMLDDSRTELFALFSNGLAMARNPGDLRQFPSPIVHPIGTQILIGLNLRTP
jgi:outer membrane receptor for ferrienterochelin and colicin